LVATKINVETVKAQEQRYNKSTNQREYDRYLYWTLCVLMPNKVPMVLMAKSPIKCEEISAPSGWEVY
jgi:hypothetical protein